MGNLTMIAKVCDCFEPPWDEYRPPSPPDPQPECSANAEPSSQNNQICQDLQLEEPNQVVIQFPSLGTSMAKQQFQNEDAHEYKQYPQYPQFPQIPHLPSHVDKKQQLNILIRNQQHSPETQRTDEMEVIDLDKIKPIINLQAEQRANKNKRRRRAFSSAEKQILGKEVQVGKQGVNQDELQQNEQNLHGSDTDGDSLSNLFEQTKGRYFVAQNDEVQFYEVAKNK